MSSIHRIIIHGLGAVGGAIAAALTEAGHEVVGIARGAQLAALRDGPLTIRMPEGTMTQRVEVVGAPAEIAFRSDDAVLLCMKTQDTWAALLALREAGLRDQPVFCFQNGISGEDMALRFFPNVHGVMVMMPVNFLQPGLIDARGAPKIGLFDIGRYPSGVDDDTHAMAAILEGPRMGGFVHEDVMASKRGKLLLNVANAVDAATGEGWRGSGLGKQARDEAEAVFRAAGLEWDEAGAANPKRQAFMQFHDVPGAPKAGSSTRQSLQRGTGSIETDFLNGEIARLGRLHGVDTPVNAFLTWFAARMLAEGIAPASLSQADLTDRFQAWAS